MNDHLKQHTYITLLYVYNVYYINYVSYTTHSILYYDRSK